MVKMVNPQPGERICDPAAGTCGFLVNAWQHLLETHPDPEDLAYDSEGWPHGLTGARLSREEWDFAQTEGCTGYDSDSGMTMLRLGSMNLMLHGITAPRFRYADTLSKAYNEERLYDVVLANPPFNDDKWGGEALRDELIALRDGDLWPNGLNRVELGHHPDPPAVVHRRLASAVSSTGCGVAGRQGPSPPSSAPMSPA